MKKLALLFSTLSVLAIAAPAKALTQYNFTTSTGTVDSSGNFVTGSNVDNALVTVSVPFAFSIYDTSFAANSNIRVSTNGTVQFVGTGGQVTAGNVGLPANAFGANVPVIAAYWDDLTLTPSGGGIYTSSSGTVGSRVFDIEWRGRRTSDGTIDLNTYVEVRLFENSNTFQIVYGQTGVGPNANGAGATVGVQAANSGTQFTQYSLNGTSDGTVGGAPRSITSGLRLTANAVAVPFGFSPIAALGFIGGNIARRMKQKAA